MVRRLTIRFLAGSVVLGWALALGPAAALAQTCSNQSAPQTAEPAAFNRLFLLETTGCLGGGNDQSALAAKVATALKPPIAADAPVRSPFVDALTILQDSAASLSNSGTDALFTRLALKIAQARDLLGTRVDPALPPVWQLVDGDVSVLTAEGPGVKVSLQSRVNDACKQVLTACTAEFERVRETLRIAGLTRKVLNEFFGPVFQGHLEATTIRLKQWGEYFDTARSQYPWELWTNGKLMRDTRKADAAGVKQGFRDVPSSQLILLHPSIAFEYDSKEPEGQQLNGVAIVDIIGFNKWTWTADGGMGRAVGVTIVATIGDKVSSNNLAWGAMVHVNHKYSFGFTARRDAAAFVVSGDVSKLWAKVPQSARERIVRAGSQ